MHFLLFTLIYVKGERPLVQNMSLLGGKMNMTHTTFECGGERMGRVRVGDKGFQILHRATAEFVATTPYNVSCDCFTTAYDRI